MDKIGQLFMVDQAWLIHVILIPSIVCLLLQSIAVPIRHHYCGNWNYTTCSKRKNQSMKTFLLNTSPMMCKIRRERHVLGQEQ